MFGSTWIINLIVLSLTFWIALYFYFTRNFNYWQRRNVSYVPPVPFFGNALEVFTLRKNLAEMSRTIYESTLKPYIGFFICDDPYLLIRDPELVKSVLVKNFSFFSNRTLTENKKDDPVGSHMLFLLKNPYWKPMRRKVSRVFTSAKMKSMYSLIHEVGLEMIEYIKENIENNSVLDIRDTVSRYTTETISSAAFGIKANCFKNDEAEFKKIAKTVFNWKILERAISTTCYFVAPTLVKWFKLKFIDRPSADFLRKAFYATMRSRVQSKAVRNDVLDVLIEIKSQEEVDDPYKLEGDILVAQAVQFFLAGFETTASAINFALFELAKHMDIQNKLRNEIQDVVKKWGNMSYEAFKDMIYLDMCMKETLRKYPILGFLDRRCNANFQLPGTHLVVEKDIPIFISVIGLHYDSKYYPDPEKFDPMRFTEENIKSRPQCTYLPFGDGPRYCLGARFGKASFKSCIAKIISTFQIELSDQTQNSIKLETKGFLMLPASEICLKFIKCK